MRELEMREDWDLIALRWFAYWAPSAIEAFGALCLFACWLISPQSAPKTKKLAKLLAKRRSNSLKFMLPDFVPNIYIRKKINSKIRASRISIQVVREYNNNNNGYFALFF